MRFKNIILAFVLLPLLSGLLMWAAWPPLPFTFLVFVALVPLLLAEKLISGYYQNFVGLKVWLAMFIGLSIWNISTTWWVGNASATGGLFANVANAILMTIPIMATRNARRVFGERIGNLAFVVFWMTFELIHLNWELTWPWLSLGNVFALNHTWVQWYAYTGVFGGTLWVLITNLLVFNWIKKYVFGSQITIKPNKRQLFKPAFLFIAIIVVPITISKIIYTNTSDKGSLTHVTVVQPNFDPFTEKFAIPYSIQMEKMIVLSKSKINDSTSFLVWPETAIQSEIWLDKIKFEKPVRDLKKELDSFPNLTMVLGINGFERYNSGDDISATAREMIYNTNDIGGADTMFFDIYNTALAINSTGPIGYYHKSKLVPGAERMPYPEFFSSLGKWAIDLGGIQGSLGIQKERTVFFNNEGIGVAPVICYESVFGAYVTEYVKKGAGLIFIITNDGWWGNTDGYKQHCLYAKLRSIETRRSIARSANTGISCFINQRGDITQPTGWREDAAISASLAVNTEITFYTRYGDYLAIIAMVIALIILSATMLMNAAKRFNKKASL